MESRIVEINGVKMEVDLREAKTVDTYRVGDHVKVLVAEYADSMKAHAGAIIGFDNFKSKPTIVVAYLDAQYGKAEVKLAYIFEGSKTEIVHASDGDVPFSKAQVLELLDRDVAAKQKALDESHWHKERFEAWFGRHFAPEAVTEGAAV